MRDDMEPTRDPGARDERVMSDPNENIHTILSPATGRCAHVHGWHDQGCELSLDTHVSYMVGGPKEAGFHVRYDEKLGGLIIQSLGYTLAALAVEGADDPGLIRRDGKRRLRLFSWRLSEQGGPQYMVDRPVLLVTLEGWSGDGQ